MYVKAIEKCLKFTKPLLTGQMIYKDKTIINGISTLMVLNKDGDILTTAHVAEFFRMADEINEVFLPILTEFKNKSDKEIKKLEKKYDIKENDLVAIHNVIVDVAENPGRLDVIVHPTLDMAIIKLTNKNKIFVDSFPIFKTKNLEVGEKICKLGFAFPEYDTFYYDEESCQIRTHNRLMNFPLFPLDGMVTRNIIDPSNKITLFEISTPLFPGQAGGPVFDEKGVVCGMLLGTKRIASNYAQDMNFHFDLGLAFHVNTITDFLDAHNIKYNKTSK